MVLSQVIPNLHKSVDSLFYHDYSSIDTVFFHKENPDPSNAPIIKSWDDGVGIVNYRGWGDSNGWKKPQFFREDIDPGLNNNFRLPIVMSFVCNTGDFGRDECFGDVLCIL